MNLEDIFIEIARNIGGVSSNNFSQKIPKVSDKHTILLFDKGVMDGSAYTDENVWQAILDETGWSTIQLRDRRYEAVIHMMTAAEGAEGFYMSSSNKDHAETLEEAKEIDRKLISAWCGHP
jgi:hypothetical protein